MKSATRKRKFLLISLDVILLLVAWQLKSILSLMLGAESQCDMLKRGLICPACGGTRCAFYFVTGEFARAFSYHPAMFCIFCYVILLLISWNLEILFGLGFAKTTRKFMTDYRTILAAAICYVAVGLSRNFVGDWSHLY